jgi:HD superfamily phosphohydrolase
MDGGLYIQVFKGDIIACYDVSSQLNMDRMDYLKRDSFIRVAEECNSERLIQMMNVVDDVLGN